METSIANPIVHLLVVDPAIIFNFIFVILYDNPGVYFWVSWIVSNDVRVESDATIPINMSQPIHKHVGRTVLKIALSVSLECNSAWSSVNLNNSYEQEYDP